MLSATRANSGESYDAARSRSASSRFVKPIDQARWALAHAHASSEAKCAPYSANPRSNDSPLRKPSATTSSISERSRSSPSARSRRARFTARGIASAPPAAPASAPSTASSVENTAPTSAPASPPAHVRRTAASQKPPGDTTRSKPACFACRENHCRARASRRQLASESVAPRASRWLSDAAYRTQRSSPPAGSASPSRAAAALRNRSRRAVAARLRSSEAPATPPPTPAAAIAAATRNGACSHGITPPPQPACGARPRCPQPACPAPARAARP